jgi:hypothetical protein
LPAQSARGGTIPARKIKRLIRISSILGNIAVFARGIPFIEKYDRVGDFTKKGRFSAF